MNDIKDSKKSIDMLENNAVIGDSAKVQRNNLAIDTLRNRQGELSDFIISQLDENGGKDAKSIKDKLARL